MCNKSTMDINIYETDSVEIRAYKEAIGDLSRKIVSLEKACDLYQKQIKALQSDTSRVDLSLNELYQIIIDLSGFSTDDSDFQKAQILLTTNYIIRHKESVIKSVNTLRDLSKSEIFALARVYEKLYVRAHIDDFRAEQEEQNEDEEEDDFDFKRDCDVKQSEYL